MATSLCDNNLENISIDKRSNHQFNTNVLLGYPDEIIAEQYVKDVDFSTSKIGGQPDWINLPPPPYSDSNCSICGNPSSLIVQIYAPLEDSIYDRTLYVFACIQPECWNRAESWKCFRGQRENQPKECIALSNSYSTKPGIKASDWLSNADDWGSDDDECENDVQCCMEEDEDEPFEVNQMCPRNAQATTISKKTLSDTNKCNENVLNNLLHMSISDKRETDEYSRTRTLSSSSNSSSLSPASSKIKGKMAEDPNANPSPKSSGAIGGANWDEVVATAEIEIEEGEKGVDLGGIVAVESPEMDTCDINNAYSSNILKYFSPEEIAKASPAASSLDNQPDSRGLNNIPLSNSSKKCSTATTTHTIFTPYFLAVEEEDIRETDQINDHERQLLSEYKSKEGGIEDKLQNMKKEGKGTLTKTKREVVSHESSDSYEKTLPKHGDIHLHKMISTISRNPGQVIRYTRDINQKPLFIAKPVANQVPSRCKQCHGSLVCELQLLPSLITALDMGKPSEERKLRGNCKHQNVGKNKNIDQGGKDHNTTEVEVRDTASFIEFGTIMIYTCQSSCTPSSLRQTPGKNYSCTSTYLEEQIMLQTESV